MKKTTLLTLAIMAGATATSFAANPIIDNPDNKPYLGARLSVESVIPGDLKAANIKEEIFDPGAGVSLGLVYNQPIIANFTVEPGLELYYNTTKFDLDDDELMNLRWKGHSTRSFGMRVPVMLGYHFDFSRNFSLNVATGPVLKVGFSNDYNLTSETFTNPATGEPDRIHKTGTMYNDYRRVDCAWRISLGANFLTHYYAGISGDLGMVNQIKHNNNGAMVQKNNLFQFTLGYNF